MDGHKKNRHRTLWLGVPSNAAVSKAPKRGISESSTPSDIIKRLKTNSTDRNNLGPLAVSACHEQDPWTVYEWRANAFHGRRVTLARHRENRSEIVDIQCLALDRSRVRSLLETITRLSHHSFLNLLASYYYENQLFLVWEPVELSVKEIVDARHPVNETELAQILWPTLKGIRHLRDQGRALATLGAEAILLKENGGVRLAGVEDSCHIQPSEMNADTLKLTALAAIMTSLMQVGGDQTSWSSAAQQFLHNLTGRPLDDLFRDPFFAQMEGEGVLKSCVCIASKTVDNHIEFLGYP